MQQPRPLNRRTPFPRGAYAKHSSKKPRHQNTNALPIPKGDSPYAKAKKAEYILKDLQLAKTYYQQAIHQNQRVESAVKDIASILHQQHRTQQACEFLLKYQAIFTDEVKFYNLYTNLQKQIIPTGNCLNMILKISPIDEFATPKMVTRMFKNSNRVNQVVVKEGCAFVYFPSHSAARKTLEGFEYWEQQKVEWVSVDGIVQGEAIHGHTCNKPVKLENEVNPFQVASVDNNPFLCSEHCDLEHRNSIVKIHTNMDLFQKPADPRKSLELELDSPGLTRGVSENTAQQLLGTSLLEEITEKPDNQYL